jgi:hypothetical protein
MTVAWKKLAYDADKISHSLATAANDFLVASGAGVFVKKSLSEVTTLFAINLDGGSAASVYGATTGLDGGTA